MASNRSWNKIFSDLRILEHNFDVSPFILSASDIKTSCQDFKTVNEKEVRILCKQDSREARPEVFAANDLFILPINNGRYALVKGEGYVDIPEIVSPTQIYSSKLDFDLESSRIGNSEMQHLDFAYASSLIRTFMEDPSLVLTIRGRKYTPEFAFRVGNMPYTIEVKSVQTEVDAGYEGRDQIVLVEAKNSQTRNTIIRQLYYPYKQWVMQTSKKVSLLFFEKRANEYHIWQYSFRDPNNYNSITLERSAKYQIK